MAFTPQLDLCRCRGLARGRRRRRPRRRDLAAAGLKEADCPVRLQNPDQLLAGDLSPVLDGARLVVRHPHGSEDPLLHGLLLLLVLVLVLLLELLRAHLLLFHLQFLVELDDPAVVVVIVARQDLVLRQSAHSTHPNYNITLTKHLININPEEVTKCKNLTEQPYKLKLNTKC